MSVPNILKDFSIWLNPTNLRAFNKIEVLKLGYKVMKTNTEPLPLEIQKELSAGLQGTNQDLAIFSLRIYFYQILKGQEFSLDLRKSRFKFDKFWQFEGVHLSHNFSDDLLQSLAKTYVLYYSNKLEGIQESLLKMKLIDPKWKEEDKLELVDIFLRHFKQSSTSSQVFKVKDLLDSFGKIFIFIKSKRGIVPSEFALIGVYITSLYMTLESTTEAVDVKSTFEFANKTIMTSNDSRE